MIWEMSASRNVHEETDQELGIYLETLLPYLNSLSEEGLYLEVIKLKRNHETMKLQNAEVLLKNF